MTTAQDHHDDWLPGGLLSEARVLALAIARLIASWDMPYSLASWRRLLLLWRSASSDPRRLGTSPLDLTSTTDGAGIGNRPIWRY